MNERKPRTGVQIKQTIDKIVNKKHRTEEEIQLDQIAIQLGTFRTKLDSLLVSNNLIKSDETRQHCVELITMKPDKREEHISQIWGPLYLEKAQPLLIQIQKLEEQLASIKAQ